MIPLKLGLLILFLPPQSKLVEDVVSSRSQYIKECVTVLKESGTGLGAQNRRHSALKVLGILRANEASTIIMEHIQDYVVDDAGISRLRGFPAAKALRDIGSPCVPTMIARLNEEVSDDELLLLAVVMAEIDGNDVAIFRLERERRIREKDALQEAKEKVGIPKSLGRFGVNCDKLLDMLRDLSKRDDDPLATIRQKKINKGGAGQRDRSK